MTIKTRLEREHLRSLTPEQRKQRLAEQKRAHAQSPKGKATAAVYNASDARKRSKVDYSTSAAGRAKVAAYRKSPRERQRRTISQRNFRLSKVATCDFETDPFNNLEPYARIEPFLFCLYRADAEPDVLWRAKDETENTFIFRVFQFIESLPGEYIIYAHNGGKFDYMYLLKLLRGEVQFKGSAIMNAKIGAHTLRDSLHICPGRLANYRKDEIDYNIMKRDRRHGAKNKAKIIEYCIADCRYLHERVTHFLERHGFRLSVGQAALKALRKKYTSIEMLTESVDEYIRPFFFGGRVECIQGMQWLRKKKLRLYDVNSMYPSRMAECAHPIGRAFNERRGNPGPDTVFIELKCNNNGAFLARVKGENGPEVTTEVKHGTFYTTIWEYNVALKYKLISNVTIIRCIDFKKRVTFADFVMPLYNDREKLKVQIDAAKASGLPPEVVAKLRLDSEDLKNLLNNGYGKFAQNPRRFVENYLTAPNCEPPPDPENPWGTGHGNEWLGTAFTRTQDYWIWQRPSPSDRYNNVATGASITGAARAKLLEALQHAKNPYYCDTDSILCEELDASAVEINPAKLGAWKLEAEYDEAIIVAKKGYFLYNSTTGEEKKRWKGAPSAALTRSTYEAVYRGEIVQTTALGVTMTKHGEQYYVPRKLRATAKRKAEKCEV